MAYTLSSQTARVPVLWFHLLPPKEQLARKGSGGPKARAQSLHGGSVRCGSMLGRP